MIRVVRGAAPSILSTDGIAAADALIQQVHADPASANELEFDSQIYAHRSVKQQLIDDHHGKCAFCESRITHISYGDVEHFRPKKAVAQAAGEPIRYPGYYWLSYTWENLLLSCQLCNQRHKRNLFPLADPAKRATGPDAMLSEETPLFLDPTSEHDGDNPESHIGFRDSTAFGRSDRGEVTWVALGLNRPELRDLREQHLNNLKLADSIVKLDRAGKLRAGPETEEVVANAVRLLHDAVGPEAQWTSMARCLLQPGT